MPIGSRFEMLALGCQRDAACFFQGKLRFGALELQIGGRCNFDPAAFDIIPGRGVAEVEAREIGA